MAVLSMPVDVLLNAPFPKCVFPLVCACAIGESAKHANTMGMRRRASREGDRPIDFIERRVVIFCFFV
jgi:hypothetical protein